MLIKSNNRQTISKKAAARKCSRLFAYILCTMKTEMRVLTSARRRTRSGGPRPARTGAERRHRTFEPRIGLENKKERCFMHHSFLFISARRGSKPFPPVARVFQRLARGNLATGRGRFVRFTGYYVSLLPKVGEPPQAAVLPPTFET